jgi:NAD(P)-dependent dehydrogenase (short-subunit alcohol dehydrogenase family)
MDSFGGRAGIGRAAALRFAEAGARVVITGRRPEPLKALTEDRDNLDFVLADASGGNIVNISSTFGQKVAARLSHYAASKAALEHMTRCWALELADQRIRVNAVAAGPTETDFLRERMGLSDEQAEVVKAQERSRIPLGRRGLPEEVAAWIVALASDAGGWITGQVITVDGGLSII